MTGEEALAAYGDVLGENGMYGRPVNPGGSQQWKQVEGGWLRFDPGNEAVPYVATTALGNLDYKNADHAEHFEWVWPDEHVARTYAHAADQAAKGWPSTGEAHHVGGADGQSSNS